MTTRPMTSTRLVLALDHPSRSCRRGVGGKSGTPSDGVPDFAQITQAQGAAL